MDSRVSLPGISQSLRAAACLLVGLGAPCSAVPASFAADGAVVTAVSSQASDGYVRERLPDGSLQPEAYTFGNGGHLPGPSHDDTIDRLGFEDVAKALVGPLADQKYVAAADSDPNRTRLIIMVYWGTTTGTEGSSGSAAYENLQGSQPRAQPPPPPPPSTGGGRPAGVSAGGPSSSNLGLQSNSLAGELGNVAAEEEARDQADFRNAQLLGYDSALAAAEGPTISTFKLRRDDLIAEIEQSRYFVVLMAYDFQDLWKHKRHRLLWVTRMSVREGEGDFSKMLPMMAGYASQFFGKDSGGLLRKTLPDGKVNIGEVKSLGPVP